MNSYQQYGPNQNQRLFGFSYKEDELEQIAKVSPVPPNMDDGVTVAAGGLYGYAVDLDQTAGRDYELIRRELLGVVRGSPRLLDWKRWITLRYQSQMGVFFGSCNRIIHRGSEPR